MSVAAKESSNWLSNYVCLGGMYPTKGILGCLEKPIDINTLPKALRDEIGLSAEVSELKRLQGRPAKWFLPGDIVVRYPGIAESASDIFRRKSDVVMVNAFELERAAREGSEDRAVDWETVDRLREESLETHRWSIDKTRRQFTLCDPFGRVFVRIPRDDRRKATTKKKASSNTFRKVADHIEDVLVRGSGAENMPYFQESAWHALKSAHAFMMAKGPDGAMLRVAERKCHEEYHLRLMMGSKHRTDRMCIRRNPAHKIRKSIRPFWGRVESDPGAPAVLKGLNQRETAGDQHFVRWLDMSVEDFESVLKTVWWDEHQSGVWPWEMGYANVGSKKKRPENRVVWRRVDGDFYKKA